jgi:hypothetical protein
MKTTEENILAAPCGLYCGDCVAYMAKDDPVLLESLIAKGLNKDQLPCPGCRAGEGTCPVIDCACATYSCVEGRALEFCFECSKFPCEKLNPAADKAAILPHNIKVFNLCYIKQHGLSNWLGKAQEIRQKYFCGKMAIGKGPQME